MGLGGPEYEKCPADELVDAYGQLEALEMTVRVEKLRVLAALATTDFWKVDGAASLADWLATRLGACLDTARELVRVAEALADLPAISETASEGRLSWDQLRYLVSIATPESDQLWALEAPGYSAARLRAFARAKRRVTEAETAATNGRRSLRWWHEVDDNGEMLRLSGRLPVADGAVVVSAVSHLAEAAPVGANGLYEPFASRCADGLVELCSAGLANEADADRATVVVHVDADALTEGAGQAVLGDGTPVGLDIVRRLACDARVQLVAHNKTGVAVGVGGARRIASPSLLRVVTNRDQACCRHPGCERGRLLQAHHIVHWSQGGPTNAHNLVILCRFHHRFLHEHHWKIQGSPYGTLRFIKPNGEVLESSPPGLRPEIRQRLFGPDGFD